MCTRSRAGLVTNVNGFLSSISLPVFVHAITSIIINMHHKPRTRAIIILDNRSDRLRTNVPNHLSPSTTICLHYHGNIGKLYSVTRLLINMNFRPGIGGRYPLSLMPHCLPQEKVKAVKYRSMLFGVGYRIGHSFRGGSYRSRGDML